MRAPLAFLCRPSRRGSRLAGLAGLAVMLLLAAAGLVAPGIVLPGWLIAFASLGGVALGCIAWLAIHALTGGRWGMTGRPALLAGAGALPVVAVLVLPLVLADRWLYPWVADTDAAGPGVAHLYLNRGTMALRSLALIVGLALFARRARRGGLQPLAAALALVLYGGLMNLSAFDWLLSLDPRYTSSAIGMQVIVGQLLSALCLVVLAIEAPGDDPVWSDYGGLMLACLLGEAYLILMTLVVQWYGNLPEQADWYLRRSLDGWLWLEVIGTLVGAIGPGLALLFGRVRHSPSALRITALAILAGILAQNIWFVAPAIGSDGVWAVPAGLAALVACGALMAAGAGRLAPRPAPAAPEGAAP